MKILSPNRHVHVATWHPGTQGWEPGCARLTDTAVIGYDWPEVPDSRPVTCKRCLRTDPSLA